MCWAESRQNASSEGDFDSVVMSVAVAICTFPKQQPQLTLFWVVFSYILQPFSRPTLQQSQQTCYYESLVETISLSQLFLFPPPVQIRW